MKITSVTCDRCGKRIPQYGENDYETFGTFMQHRFNSTSKRVSFIKKMEQNTAWMHLDPDPYEDELDLCNECRLSLYIWVKEGRND